MCVPVTQQQAEEVREEALARAREKQEFRQKNRDAAGTTETHHNVFADSLLCSL